MTTTATKTVKGVLGEKLGMTQVWDEENRLVPVTVIQAGPCVVTQVRNEADILPAFLSHIAAFADDAVLMDHGSVTNTSTAVPVRISP